MSKLDAKVFSSITPFSKQWILGDELMYDFLYKYPEFLSDKYGIVDLGSLDWDFQTYTIDGVERTRFRSSVINNMNAAEPLLNMFTEKYKINRAPIIQLNIDKTICGYTKQLYVVDWDYTDADAYKAAMQGVYLIYEKN